MKDELENELESFSYKLCPFSLHDQTTFLKKFWQNKLATIENLKKIEDYAAFLILETSETIIEKNFFSIPLHTFMLAYVYKDMAEIFDKSDEIKPKLKKKLTLHDMYKTFIEIKYNIYLKEKAKSDLDQIESRASVDITYPQFLDRHQNLALYTLFYQDEVIKKMLITAKFSQEFYQEHPILADTNLITNNKEIFESAIFQEGQKKILDLIKKIDAGEERTGIIDNIFNNIPQFIHKTYAEYFFAQYLVKMLDLQNQIVIEFILKEILIKPNHQEIRKFFNSLIENKKYEAYHYGEKILDLWKLDKLEKNTILHIAVKESLYNLVGFVVNSLNFALKSFLESVNAIDDLEDSADDSSSHSSTDFKQILKLIF